MKFRTEVTLPEAAFTLRPSSHVLLLGSCFAEEVGARLCDALPEGHVRVNPCGVLYNPSSIAQALRLLMADEAGRCAMLCDSLFEAPDGRWHSWLMSTKFTGCSRQEALDRCLDSLPEAMAGVDVLVLTLGTDRCYALRDDQRVVANCHKVPASRFDERTCPPGALTEALAEVHTRFPQLQVLLTVSPYRYAKYGFHESQLSKARLLLMVDELCRQAPTWISYFPAYELLLDELRDYRFYAQDMLHPSDQAADYIFERFADWCFSAEMRQFAGQRARELKQQRHIPNNSH